MTLAWMDPGELILHFFCQGHEFDALDGGPLIPSLEVCGVLAGMRLNSVMGEATDHNL